jgi:TonB family protein
MKQCSTCQEQFADKFSFCPVDGTPLNGFAAKRVAPPPTDPEETLAAFSAPSANVAESEPATSAAPSPTPAAAHDEYHLTIIEDAGLTRRLMTELSEVAHESQLTWPEFKRDPIGFVKRSVSAYGTMLRGFLAKPNVGVAMLASVLSMILVIVGVVWIERNQAGGVPRVAIIMFALVALAMLISIFASWMKRDRSLAVAGAEPADTGSVVIATMAAFVFVLAVVGGVIWADHRRQQVAAADKQQQDVEFLASLTEIPADQPEPEEGTAGLNKGKGGGSKPKQEKPGGGGGGGREDPKPASFGKVPEGSLTIPPIVAPNPKPPPPTKDPLLVVPTLDADPLLIPRDDRPIPYGDNKSTSTDPSSGPGKGGGIGDGTGVGVGPGEGAGYGPGRGGNVGGGDRHLGGGGPGGGGGGKEVDYNKIFKGSEVTSKVRILSKPEPPYTEDARKNQITGTVVLAAVFSASGQVTGIRPVSGLPHGLTEKAIAAARQIRFVPAQKDGRPVSMYYRIEYNFNLY